MSQRRGGSFYDDQSAFDAYLNHRHAAVSSPNLVMEDPAFTQAVGPLAGRRILDLGCGDGTFAAVAADAGVASYLGIDGSQRMIERARHAVSSERVRFEQADMEDYRSADESFDLVTSRLALHYLADLSPVLTNARRALVDGGQFVATVVHPVVTAAATVPDGPRQAVEVDDYFEPGPRTRSWFNSEVTWFHRTVEHYIDAVLSADFSIEAVRECAPVEALFDGDTSEFERRRRAPLFLLLAATPS